MRAESLRGNYPKGDEPLLEASAQLGLAHNFPVGLTLGLGTSRGLVQMLDS